MRGGGGGRERETDRRRAAEREGGIERERERQRQRQGERERERQRQRQRQRQRETETERQRDRDRDWEIRRPWCHLHTLINLHCPTRPLREPLQRSIPEMNMCYVARSTLEEINCLFCATLALLAVLSKTLANYAWLSGRQDRVDQFW